MSKKSQNVESVRFGADALGYLGVPVDANERLRSEMLCERYRVGTSPIREALMRLEAEGLVELEQNRA